MNKGNEALENIITSFINKEDDDLSEIIDLNLSSEEISMLPDELYEAYLNSSPQLRPRKPLLNQYYHNVERYLDAIDKAALSAYIVDKFNNDKNLGRVKLQKALYLIDIHFRQLQITRYKKFAAGPHDKHLEEYEELANTFNWYKMIKIEYTGNNEEAKYKCKYKPAENIKEGINIAIDLLEDKKADIDLLLEKLKPLTWKQCEIIATLHSVWNELILRKDDTSINSIITSFYKFHPSKKQHSRKNLELGIQWIKNNNIVPLGLKKSTQ